MIRDNPAWTFHLDEVYEWAYWESAFTKEECETIVKEGLRRKPDSATVGTGKGELDEKIRKCNVSWISPTDENAWMYRRLTDIILNLNNRYFKFDLYGITEQMQFTEYKSNNGHYSKHVDRRNGVVTRKLSVSVQLTDPRKYKGGELLLYLDEKPTKANSNQGDLVVFPSYTMHEVTPVKQGTRHSLVVWVTGKHFI